MFANRLKGILPVLVLAVSLTACGKSAENVPTTANVSEETVASEETETEMQSEEDAGSGTASSDNLIKNGDFHNELVGWGTYVGKGGVGTMTNKGGEGNVKINKVGNANYAVQAYYDGFELKNGGVYEFAFDMSSTVSRQVEARIQVNGGDYHPYTDQYIDVNSDMQHYSFTFTMEEGTDPAPRLCFNLGKPEGVDSLDEHDVRLDNVSLILVDASGIAEEDLDVEVSDINTNQVGFLPSARKTFVARCETEGNNNFEIIDESGNVVYTGSMDGQLEAKAAGEKVYRGDFSDFKTIGTYKIRVADHESFPFVIGDEVYNDILKDSVIFLYSQRCGCEIDKNIVGAFAHKECHTGDAVVYGTDEHKTVKGGWHDAGDYGRYVVPGAVTVADLFLTYDDNKELWDSEFGDNVGIPESGNGIPDILDEAKYELEFMLQMQDGSTGGVYHKISGYEFPGFVMPDAEKEQMVLAPISSAATADFAAVMARASVIYKSVDSRFASDCLDAAKRAWTALESMPVGQGYHNPDDILTGEYPDMRDVDERYWAAIELYKVTGDKKYEDYFSKDLDQYVMHGFGWAQVSSYGNIAYLSMDSKKQNQNYVNKIKDDILRNADEIFQKVQSDGYRCDLGEDYVWGSNMLVVNNARQLLLAYSINNDINYKNAAYDQLSYILGQNATSYCFVTGYGSLSPENAHHRPSMATGEVLPGMLVGGPDKNLEDPFAKATLAGLPMAKCYADSDQSYSTNEVTIYWNSPFIYLISNIITSEGN